MNHTKDQDQHLARFMAGVNHDLKTPLNAVVGFTSVLLQDPAGMDEEKARQLALIARSARKLLARLDALIEFFRLRAGAIEPRPDWLDPSMLINQAAELARESAEPGIPVEILSVDLPGRIRVDGRLLRRILDEILANAVKLGTATTLQARTDPDRRSGAVQIHVTVTDQGPGVGQDLLEQLQRALGPVFKPEDGARKSTFEGLGLGLALCREAAGRLGGWIEVDSQPDRGSKFTLVLELKQADVGE